METIKPMLATPGQDPFDDPNYIFDWKYNGNRLIGVKDGDTAVLQARSGRIITDQYPELKGWEKLVKANQAVIDGEVVVLGANGLPDFNRLQNHARAGNEVTWMVFDILRVDDYDLTAEGAARATQMQRKEILGKIIQTNGILKVTPWVDGQGKALHAQAVKLEQEGVMAKTKSGLYYPGGRGQEWVKLKVPKFADLAICGWTKGTGWRESLFGAVILGHPYKGSFIYVGCAGSGFTQQGLDEMYALLQSLRSNANPFGHPTTVPGFVSWVEPALIARIKYFDITKDGMLIWPIFQKVQTGMKVEEVNNCIMKLEARP